MALLEISPITSSDSGLAVLNPIAVSLSSTQPAAVVDKSALAASSPTGASAPITAGPRRSAARRDGGGRAALSSTTEQLLTDTYTTTVDGKSYSETVQQEPDGEFVAFAPNLPGATASGSSIQAAELALGTIVDAIA